MADILDRLHAALADRYTIDRELGSGGMATVYLARDLKHERQVAVKVLRPELAASLGADRFLREIKIAANLNHPHILPLHDSGEADGFLYYVMPYVEGESLREKLNREKQLPIAEALKIASEITGALGFAHENNVIHRDIKPENIMLEAGHAVVADFGIAKAVSAAGGRQLTQTGMAVGTPAYMSPEQASGGQDLDGRSDQYSLGCVLYEMLGGEPPYTGSTPQAVISKKLSEPIPRISVVRELVPPAVESVLLRTLAKTPADRFATMSQLAEALSGEPPARAAFAAASSGPADRGGATVTADVLSKLIGYSRLSMKNDISYLSFKRSDEIVEAINSIARGIPRDSDEVFFVNQGGGTITVICEAEKERLLDSVRNQAVYYRPRVGVLSIQEAHEEDVPASIEVPGLYAYFINRLAEGGINILDLISTRTQLTVIVAEDDLTSAFSLLSDRIREHRRRGQDLA